MANYITTDTDLTSVANAIRTKGGTSEQLTYPSGFVTAIENIPTGGGSGDEKTVCYYDYDGTLVASYTPAEYAELSQHPANPTHTGLTAQGWNWTLADAKEYVATAGYLDLGQCYVTESGKTEIDISLDNPDSLTLIMTLQIKNTGLVVDWGDNSEPDELEYYTGLQYPLYFTHAYSQTGDYTITICEKDVGSGGYYSIYANTSNGGNVFRITANTSYNQYSHTYTNSITAIRTGVYFKTTSYTYTYLVNCEYITMKDTSIPSLNYICHGCSSLKQFTIPAGSGTETNDYMFDNCASIVSVAIPKGMTLGTSSFENCYNLKSVAIQNVQTEIQMYTCQMCFSLKYIYIPNTVTRIRSDAFAHCYNLKKISIPSSVTVIDTYAFMQSTGIEEIITNNDSLSLDSSAFSSCYNLKHFTIPLHTNSIASSMFSSCSMLKEITIPQDVISIGNSAFAQCRSLKELTILSDAITTIGNNAFEYCYSITGTMNFPETLVSIGTYAFRQCSAVSKIVISLRVKSLLTYTFTNAISLSDIGNIYGVNSIDTYCFQHCDSLKDKYANAILRNITRIPQSAFDYCQSFVDIVIPSTITSIGNYAFRYCQPVAYHIRSTTPFSLPQSAKNIFGRRTNGNNTIIYVPAGCLETYQTTTNWSAVADHMQEEPAVACTGITLDKATETLAYAGDAKKITETITPYNCNQDVFYTSSDPTCVVVNNCGVIDAVDTGTCTVTATCGTQSATCTVSVAGKTFGTITNGNSAYWDVEDAGTSSARIKTVSSGEHTTGSKYRYLYRTVSSSVAPTGCKFVGSSIYPFWFSYSANSISIQCDSSIKATFYFVDVYTGATGYEDYAKYIGGDSGYDDPNVTKGDRTVSIPSGASGCVIQLYREDGNITGDMVGNVVISVA